jgi:hypothetical protein
VPSPERAPFFGGLPERGVWTAVELTRGQFATILVVSALLFVFVDGPLWRHLRDPHFTRIALSYGVIPPAVTLALYRNGACRLPLVLGASALIGAVKLLLTAALMVTIGLGR